VLESKQEVEVAAAAVNPPLLIIITAIRTSNFNRATRNPPGESEATLAGAD